MQVATIPKLYTVASQVATCIGPRWLGPVPLQARLAPDQSRFSELDAACGSLSCIFSSSWRPSLVVPLCPFSMSHEDHPYKTSYASQDAPIRISEVDYSTVRSFVARRVLTGSSTNSVVSSPILSVINTENAWPHSLDHAFACSWVVVHPRPKLNLTLGYDGLAQ